MKKYLVTIISLFGCLSILVAQSYDENFTKDRLRLDLYHFGTDSTENYSLKRFVRETPYSGPKNNLLPEQLHASYILQVRRRDNDNLLFAMPFETMFEEWQDTKEAPNRKRIFEETVFIPYPKIGVHIEIIYQAHLGNFKKIWESYFDPEVSETEIPQQKTDFSLIYGKENPQKAVDIAIIAEGYTEAEMDKFTNDANRMTNHFLNTAPFSAHKEKFNFYAVKSVSTESGTDLPGENIWKETAANSRFHTFGSERYLTTLSYHQSMDLLNGIPHDQIIILVNTDKYGGGGVFNHFSVVSSDHYLSEIVLTHEFGHAFGGLADEYYSSSTAYVEHPDLNFELIEPNITNLVNFDKKWKHMLSDTTPIPTPDTKEYDEVVGVFEGARYLSKGIYRPVRNCRMKSNDTDFCPVCQDILVEMINYYSESESD
ncbi:MAG: M64 family metallo-endopeptidase [Bacteroidales bacterium]|jgi:hypothetical protein|nr:M64 family metallo-endopeptidase [Bacteroidales bacterium]